MRIKQLRCRIRVLNAEKPHQESARTNVKPTLEYVKTLPIAPAESAFAESKDGTPTQEFELEPKKVDSQQVADHVYELMRREVRTQRIRGA